MADVLRLRAKPGLLYPHLQRAAAGTRAFIGHRYGVAAKGPAEDGSQDVYGFVHVDEVVEVPVDGHAVEYAKALADGDLLAADEATAAVCRKFTGRTVRVERAQSPATAPSTPTAPAKPSASKE